MTNSSIKCSECGNDPIYLNLGDEYCFYLCDNCGWGKSVTHPFRIGVWSVKISQALAPIDVLYSLLTSEEIVDFLRPRLKVLSYLGRQVQNFDFEDEYFRGEIEIANKVYLSQMIVLSLTYAELIVKNFYRCLYSEQPQRMNSVLLASDDKGKAKIYLNEVLEASSKDELLDRLVERAANKASSRKIDEIVSTIIKDCKLILERPVAQDLKKLNEKRNKIVHEGKLDAVEIDEVLDSYGLLMYLLYVIGEATIKYDLPFIDEVDFLMNFKDSSVVK
jgi:hypothetical protein